MYIICKFESTSPDPPLFSALVTPLKIDTLRNNYTPSMSIFLPPCVSLSNHCALQIWEALNSFVSPAQYNFFEGFKKIAM